MATTSTRQHLLDTAMRLICGHERQAISINKILTEAGVARMTFYKHFESKHDLMCAVQRQCEEDFYDWFRNAVNVRAPGPRDRLLVMFDVLDNWFKDDAFGRTQFSTWAYINGCGSSSDMSGPVRKVVAEHRRLLLDYVTDLATEAGARDAERLAKELMLLVEGAIVTAHVNGDSHSAQCAKRVAGQLVNASFPAYDAA